MYTNNNTNNSRKENYSHSNFLFYNNNYNNKKAGVALCGVSAPPCLREMNNEQLTVTCQLKKSPAGLFFVIISA